MRTNCFPRSRVREWWEIAVFTWSGNTGNLLPRVSTTTVHKSSSPDRDTEKVCHRIHALAFCHLRKSGTQGKRVKSWYWNWWGWVMLKKNQNPSLWTWAWQGCSAAERWNSNSNCGAPVALPEDNAITVGWSYGIELLWVLCASHGKKLSPSSHRPLSRIHLNTSIIPSGRQTRFEGG